VSGFQNSNLFKHIIRQMLISWLITSSLHGVHYPLYSLGYQVLDRSPEIEQFKNDSAHFSLFFFIGGEIW